MAQNVHEATRLSPQQQHLWLVQRGDQPSYYTQGRIGIAGALDITRLRQALHTLAERHDILRATIRTTSATSAPTLAISAQVALTLDNYDLSALDEQQQAATIIALSEAAQHALGDAGRASSWSFALVRLAQTQHVLLITASALCADALTLRNLLDELVCVYQAEHHAETEADAPLQYADFVTWQYELLDAEEHAIGATYWQTLDISALSRQELALERYSSARLAFRPRSLSIALNREQKATLSALTERYQISAATWLLSCWAVLLSRLSGQAAIIVGTAHDGRKYDDLRNALGLFATYLPITCQVDQNEQLCALISRVNDELNNAQLWQEYFDWKRSSDAHETELFFPYCFDFQEQPQEIVANQLVFTLQRLYSCHDRFKLKLVCLASREELRLAFHYDQLFSVDYIECLAQQFQTLLTSALAGPEVAIRRLKVLSAAERQKLLIDFNNTQVDYRDDCCVHQRFAEQAARTPDRIAVVCEDQQLTYAELERRANQTAHFLRSYGVGPDVVVGLYLERSLDLLVGLLGILKAGGAYLPLDSETPPERVTAMLASAQASVIVSHERLAEQLPTDWGVIVALDSERELIAQMSEHPPRQSLASDNLAYVIYTSGSTGAQKGVAVAHRQIVQYLHAIIERLELPLGANYALVSTIAADLGNTVVFPALCGGTLHVLRRERIFDARLLGDYIVGRAIDCVKIVPSHLRALQLAAPTQRILPRRLLVLGGEAARVEWVAELRSLGATDAIFNHYGPTETTVGVLTYCVPNELSAEGSRMLALGRPLANTRIYLLDSDMLPVPLGACGELYVGGANLARGYLNQPAATAERFVPNPFAGEGQRDKETRRQGDKEPGDAVEPQSAICNLQSAITETAQSAICNLQSAIGTRLYKTGDYAYYRLDGTIEFRGRVDNQVKVRGYRVDLAMIEQRLLEHPDLRQVAVRLWPEASDDKLSAYVVATERRPMIAGQRRYLLPNNLAIVHFNKNETDYIYEEIFVRQAYLRHGITLNDGDCVVDVGANIGLFTLFATHNRERVRVYAFEPNPTIFELLRLNMMLYGLQETVHLFNCGLSDAIKMTNFTFISGFSLLSGFYVDETNEKHVIKSYLENQRSGNDSAGLFADYADELLADRFVPQTFAAQLTTLSHVIAEQQIQQIDLLKINVEKSELDVLNGISAQDWAKIKQLVIEVDSAENLDRIVAMLEQHYDVIVDQDALLERTQLCYIYATRSAERRWLTREQAEQAHTRQRAVYASALLSTGELRQFLQPRLPDYMIPSTFIFLDQLSLTANGKVDYQALPDPSGVQQWSETEYAPPQTKVERDLVDIWRDVLHVDKVGIDDNFFELGGHSLLLVQVHSQLPEVFRARLTVVEMFEHPTIRALAAFLTQDAAMPQAEEDREDIVEAGKLRLKQRLQRQQPAGDDI